MYVLAPNNIISEYPYTLQQLTLDYPETSFPLYITDSLAAEYSVYPVTAETPPTYNPLTENLTEAYPVLIENIWVQQWSVTPATSEEVAQREAQAKENNKAQASSLLSATDWVDLGPVGDTSVIPHLVNVSEFNTYRLALRTIAVNPPVTVNPWPVKPVEIWVTE